MSALRNIRMLTRYTAWANTRLFDVLTRLPEGVATASGAGNMLTTLSHAHLEGRPHGFSTRNTDTPLALEALRQAQAHVDDWYISYADGLTDAAHDEVLHFQFVDGGAGTMTRGDMLLHVVNHKTYHRGYVADMLYQASFRPPTLDLPVFLRDAPPPP